MKKKITGKIAIFTVILVLGVCGITWYSENIKPVGVIENIKRALGEITQSSNTVAQSNVTTIDVTGITAGKETQHEHVYKTIYDDRKHWEECIVCNEKKNEVIHSFKTTWKMGYESCNFSNGYTKTCTCGYSEKGHKPCVWKGRYFTYYEPRIHVLTCEACNDQIMYSYYINSYGNGKLYIMEPLVEPGQERYPGQLQIEECYKSDGSKITCDNLGICKICGYDYTDSAWRMYHSLVQDENTNKIKCRVCKKEFGEMTCIENIGNDTPATHTYTIKMSLTNGLTFDSIAGLSRQDLYYTDVTANVTNINDTKTEVTAIVSLKTKPTIKNIVELSFEMSFNVKFYGNSCILRTPVFSTIPEKIEPTISNINTEDNNSWKKSKVIIISGTENWTDTVNIEILDDSGNNIYSGETNVINGSYSINCIPEIEANDTGRKFIARVTDASGNLIEKEFIISRVDAIAPEITSIDKTDEKWSREKNMIFTASDHGIGNVQIAFNDVADYSLASKNGTEYSREYKLTGDVYSPREANIYYKDELGNVSTKKVIIDKLDNTKPTITGASFSNNKLNITAHDRHQTEGEGSGVSKYRFLTSATKLENPEVTVENSTEVLVNENIIIPEIYKVKYVYVVAEDAVGNISEVYEVEVPQLELTSKVNLNGNNGKGVVELDWSGYDIKNKYFVIYRKQENQTEWETIVSLEEKFDENKYVDNLANDKANPITPNINIESSQENNNIEITRSSDRYRNKI